MIARTVPKIERTITQRGERHPRSPHLVCTWKVDPASKRLCCVWAAPTNAARSKAADRLRLVVP